MKHIIPNISFENCKEALEFYKNLFGGEIKNLQMSDNTQGFEGQEGKIIHVELHINQDCVLYMVDSFRQRTVGDNVSLILDLHNEDEINRYYAALSEGGNVIFQLQNTFWGALHAIVTDKYGVTWGLNCNMGQ